MSGDMSPREKMSALYRVALFRPVLTAGIIGLSLLTAFLEGIGLSFLLPIIELAQHGAPPADPSGIMAGFIFVYSFLGVPFQLKYVIFGVMAVLTVRYTSSFLVDWIRARLQEAYVRHLRITAFQRALEARISYFDQQGSDEILNAIVTQAKHAGGTISHLTTVVQQSLLGLMYLAVALYIAPLLTVLAAVLLGGITVLVRWVIESGYSVGDKEAVANEDLQSNVQAAVQGIRDVKLYGMVPEFQNRFDSSANLIADVRTKLARNKSIMHNFYQLSTAMTLFFLIYLALTVLSLSLAGLGVFLFTMFRLAPRFSNLNQKLYKIEGTLPHVVRTLQFIDDLAESREPDSGDQDLPATIETVDFQNVSFAYESGERVFEGLSLSLSRGKFAALVGPSGAGKSSIVSLLTRMYDPDAGEITANDLPIDQFPLSEWRSRVSVVRQNPDIFNTTLEENITIANRDASQAEIDRVADIAQVTEFVDDLPNGFQTVLGDEGVRLSGGQRQRVALARALLKDADIILLDEATSDLDSNTEATVHSSIEPMDRDYAMLVIAHRLSTVINADCIYTMDDGEVVESGTHEDLVAKDGIYSSLYEAQTQRA